MRLSLSSLSSSAMQYQNMFIYFLFGFAVTQERACK